MKSEKQNGKSVVKKKLEIVKAMEVPDKVAFIFSGDKKKYINKYLDDIDNCALLSCN